MTGVATSASNARANAEALPKDTNTKNTNAQKPRPESTAVFVTWSFVAPSARAGSERLAVATIMRITRPTQKIGEGGEELPMNDQGVEYKRNRKIATRAPQQTTSETRPAPAASATRSQILRAAPPRSRPDRRHTNGSPNAVKSLQSVAALIYRPPPVAFLCTRGGGS